jgi:hypothetical protein
MAKESFDKEIQFLRMLVLTSGAYSRQQFAERLGISVHTLDKTLRRLKDIVETVNPHVSDTERKEFTEALRYSYYDSADPMLLFLFRAKSIKETESIRISLLLTAMNERAYTAMELLELCSGSLPADAALPDEKTIRSDLKYLEQVGVIRKEPGPRPFSYRIHNDLIAGLTDDELLELYDYADIMANTQVPSVHGYLLRDGLKRYLLRSDTETGNIAAVSSDPYLYKYHYYSRILDEAHVFSLLDAIRSRRHIRFIYYSPKHSQSYASKNTNPLFEREMEGRVVKTLPLTIVYDHQYGRWYLLGYVARQDIVKFRVEGMTQIEEDEPAEGQLFEEMREKLERDTAYSWLIDTGRRVTVRARFFHPGKSQPNFVKERVLLQGQWGTIVEEDEESFIYEIQVNGITEIRPWIRSFGSSCEVLEPAHFRQDMIEEWKGIRAYYASVREGL